jgi:hypothetical protein
VLHDFAVALLMRLVGGAVWKDWNRHTSSQSRGWVVGFAAPMKPGLHRDVAIQIGRRSTRG